MELKGLTTPEKVAQHFGVQWNSGDPLIPLYTQIATQVNTDADPSLAALVMVSLQQRHVLYFKRSPGDCAGATPPPGISGAGQIGQAAQFGTTVGMLGGDIAEGSANFAASSLGAAIPIVGGIVSVVTGVISAISVHHAQAVAKEQAVNCSVANGFNQNVDIIDQAVMAGKASVDTGTKAIAQLVSQCKAALASVTSGHNWGWGAGQVLEAQRLFRVSWYPTIASGSVSAGGKGALIGGAALVGAKLAGIF